MVMTTGRQKLLLLLFGVVVSLIVVELSLSTAGWLFYSLQDMRNGHALFKRPDVRILCLGESTTAMDDGHAYPRQLEGILNDMNLGMRFQVINKGVPGIYTTGILLRLSENLDKYNPDIVITMMGINDPLEDISEPGERIGRGAVLFLNSFKTGKLLLHLAQAYQRKSLQVLEGNPVFLSGNADSFEYLAMGENYLVQNNLAAAERMFEAAVNADPHNHEAYASLAGIYIERYDFAAAEKLYLQNLNLNPYNLEVLDDLAEIYYFMDRHEDSERLIQQALDLDPHYAPAYAHLAKYNRLRGNLHRSEQILLDALSKVPTFLHDELYAELAQLYVSMNRTDQLEQVYRKAIAVSPDNERLLSMFGVFYLERGEDQRAGNYLRKAAEIRRLSYNPETAVNYRQLRQILAWRGVRLVAMQYPMRDVRILKQMLGSDPDILFVDNGPSFREGVKRESYDSYFTDIFAGDFGHATEKGNRLLADNAARAIVNRYFRMKGAGNKAADSPSESASAIGQPAPL
ncbi:MAG: tetratricopeptide repeat protein [Candidatus Omnitrophica bacterium]|nr:tetratricopeptide repeat protein [Candidatus Omnitrophota bacterium]MCB9721404.1 tetratricopeptide repeat protein [Candidatus Omnitrophota bacterium]